jgi:transposase
VLRRRRDRLSLQARGRLEAGLVAGHPGGEVTLAWTVAQDLMALYRLDDPDLARARTGRLIADPRACPIDELARLGRTLRAWRTELSAHFTHPAVSNGPTENLNLKVKNTTRTRPRIPQRRPLPAATVAQPGTHPRRSLTDTDQNPSSQVCCVEPL